MLYVRSEADIAKSSLLGARQAPAVARLLRSCVRARREAPENVLFVSGVTSAQLCNRDCCCQIEARMAWPADFAAEYTAATGAAPDDKDHATLCLVLEPPHQVLITTPLHGTEIADGEDRLPTRPPVWFGGTAQQRIIRYVASKCAFCRKEGVPLKRCARCNLARYCSRDCQKKDWAVHKVDCPLITTAGAVTIGAAA
jgi:hypothetical protein